MVYDFSLMAKLSASSTRWLQRQRRDPYVKQAQSQGLRSRAVFKLVQIQERDKLFTKGQRILELGAAPGSWSCKLKDWITSAGQLVAVDCLAMPSIAGVTCIQGDFTEDATHQAIETALEGYQVDGVVSDMLPNQTGVLSVDLPCSYVLNEAVLECCEKYLKPGGFLLIKVLQGSGFESFMTQLKTSFKIIHSRKPDASRSASRELYLVAKDYTKGIG